MGRVKVLIPRTVGISLVWLAEMAMLMPDLESIMRRKVEIACKVAG
jgi:hypothetical protein